MWLAENTKRTLCACSENWTFPEVAILGADQKERGIWGRECMNGLRNSFMSTARALVTHLFLIMSSTLTTACLFLICRHCQISQCTQIWANTNFEQESKFSLLRQRNQERPLPRDSVPGDSSEEYQKYQVWEGLLDFQMERLWSLDWYQIYWVVLLR